MIEYLALVGVVLAAATLFVGRRREGHSAGAVQESTWGFLIVGGALMAAYLLLGAAGTGIGTPSDIGGGFLALLSYVLTVVGVVKAVRDRRNRGASAGQR